MFCNNLIVESIQLPASMNHRNGSNEMDVFHFCKALKSLSILHSNNQFKSSSFFFSKSSPNCNPCAYCTIWIRSFMTANPLMLFKLLYILRRACSLHSQQTRLDCDWVKMALMRFRGHLRRFVKLCKVHDWFWQIISLISELIHRRLTDAHFWAICCFQLCSCKSTTFKALLQSR